MLLYFFIYSGWVLVLKLEKAWIHDQKYDSKVNFIFKFKYFIICDRFNFSFLLQAIQFTYSYHPAIWVGDIRMTPAIRT